MGGARMYGVQWIRFSSSSDKEGHASRSWAGRAPLKC